MKTSTIVISITIALVLIGGAVVFFGRDNSSNPISETVNNVSVVNGTQMIAITARGGYLPRVTTASANIPTVIKMTTKGTFDCSSALTIPAIDYRTNLAPSGVTEIEVPPQKPGTKLQGICAMGMYSFAINFE